MDKARRKVGRGQTGRSDPAGVGRPAGYLGSSLKTRV